MKSSRILVIAMVFAVAAPLLSRAQTAATTSRIKTADFTWMTGRWIGHLQNATAEQICSTPQSGEMLCLFRVFVQGRPAMYELYTLNDTSTGPELRSLHFPTDLAGKSVQQPLVMTLQKYNGKEVVFAGAPGAEVATSSLFRDTPATMNGVILFRDQAMPHIRVRWEKVAYDAKVDYNPAPAAQP